MRNTMPVLLLVLCTLSVGARPRDRNYGLVDVSALDPSIRIELRYATTRNFTGKRIYPCARCLLQVTTARKLVAAHREFVRLGYGLKVYDAYRPRSAQRLLWMYCRNRAYVADPRRGSAHNRGTAVDVTLVNRSGHEVSMPSAFDTFSYRSSSTYRGGSPAAIRHRELLARVMVRHGFRRNPREWWHFSDRATARFPLLDVPFTAVATHAPSGR